MATPLTYGFFPNNTIRESLADFLYQIGYKDTPGLDALGETTASNIRHEWNERGVEARALTATLEGATYSLSDPSAGTRRFNYTHIIRKDFFVTGSNIAAIHAGIEDLVTDQMTLRMIEWRNAMEYALWNSTLQSGQTNANRQMAGIVSVLFSFARTTTNSGASASITNVNALQRTLWRRGMKASDIFVDDVLKSRLSTASSGSSATKYIAAMDKELVDVVQTYDGDFARSGLTATLDLLEGSYGTVSTATQTGRVMVALDRGAWSCAWLRKPFAEKLPKREDGIAGVILGEATLQYKSATAGQVDFNIQ